MKKQRFFKITLLASLLVMVWVASAFAATAVTYNIAHWANTSTQKNQGLKDTGFATSWTSSPDRYILLPTGAGGTVYVSVDIPTSNIKASGDVKVTLDISDTDIAKFGSKTSTTVTIKSGDHSSNTAELTIKSSESTNKNFVRITATFEGYLTNDSGGNLDITDSTQVTLNPDSTGLQQTTGVVTSKGSADIYYKVIDAPAFTYSTDLKNTDIDDPEAATFIVTANSIDLHGKRPFRFWLRATEGLTEVPTWDSATTKLMSTYGFSILTSRDTVQDTANKQVAVVATTNDQHLATSPDVGYWILVSGDGATATTSSGINLKFTAKNAKGSTSKTVNLIIPATTPTIRVVESTWSTAKNNGLFNGSSDVAIGTDVGTITVSVDMNLPITWDAKLPDGLTLTPNKDPHTAIIKGKLTTEQSFNLADSSSHDLWVSVVNDNYPDVTSTDYFPEMLRIGAVPKFQTTAPANLSTGTPYSTTIALTNGTALSWDVVIYSGDIAAGNEVAQLMSQDANQAQYFYFSISSDDTGKSITIKSSDDQRLRYVNSKKKYIAVVTASNDLGITSKSLTINVTPTAPVWVSGNLPTSPKVSATIDNLQMKFTGALPMVLSLDITEDTKNNANITDVSDDLGIHFAVDKSGGTTYAQIFSDDILVISSDGLRNATKKLKVNVIGRNAAQTSPSTLKTFEMTIAGTAPKFSFDKAVTVYVEPGYNFDDTSKNKHDWNITPSDATDAFMEILGTGPITVTPKGLKSPLSFEVGSTDLYKSKTDNTYHTSASDAGNNIIAGLQGGRFTGTAPEKGKQTLTLTAQNTAGKATKKVTVVVVDEPTITTKSNLKKLTVGKSYSAAFKSKVKEVSWDIDGSSANSAAALLAMGLSFDRSGTLTGTVTTYPGDSIDLTVVATNRLGGQVSQDFNIPVTLAKPKMNFKTKIPDLTVGTEMTAVTFTVTAGAPGAVSGCVAPGLPEGLTLEQTNDDENGTYTYTISGTPEEATKDAKGKTKAAKVEITFEDLAGQKVTKKASILVRDVALELDTPQDAGSMGNNDTLEYDISLPGEGNATYKWSAKMTTKVKGLKVAVDATSKKGVADNGTVTLTFTTKKAAAGTATILLTGKNTGDSKLTTTANVTVTVIADDTAEALKDKDNAEALKDAAEGNEATEAIESTSKTETEAADAADAKAEAGITVGGARGENSLTANEKKALEGYVIAAVLPEVTVTEDGQYEIEDVQLKEEIPAGAKLEWFAFPRSASKGDEDIVDFTDNSGAYTEVVPEDHVVTVSPWFNADVVYAPVIAVKADEVNDDDEAKTEE